ncbi:MAG: putative DNA modification/repair radical SAM protein [Bacteroidales bacterium]|nr:putative DNA modification/repair radical SAM protein [Bacteroidales bacterium]
MSEKVFGKLKILAESAKYDVSCASSGTSRPNMPGGIGSAAAWGICHSFAEDGRCISLLKIMMSNHCIYDCAYCINRRSNDLPRTTFTPEELTGLTIGFYRRNFIEGLFLSSGVIRNRDYTMEQMIRVVKDLRVIHRFNGYVHMKVIPGASSALILEAGQWADRLSVNMEIPSENNLKLLAPEKNFESILKPIHTITDHILQSKEERRKSNHAPRFSPAGQSTQLIIGATNDNDRTILDLAGKLYQKRNLKRVYYSGFIPVNAYDSRLPALASPPLQREHRLYQADWLLRFYGFNVDELVSEKEPDLDLSLDPKTVYALRNPWLYPVDINKADYATLLRVPGIGQKSARMIVAARCHSRLNSAHLKKIGVVMKRARYFITCHEIGPPMSVQDLKPETVRQLILHGPKATEGVQLRLEF